MLCLYGWLPALLWLRCLWALTVIRPLLEMWRKTYSTPIFFLPNYFIIQIWNRFVEISTLVQSDQSKHACMDELVIAEVPAGFIFI